MTGRGARRERGERSGLTEDKGRKEDVGRIEGEARAAVVRAQAQARRLGQRFIGCEHLLYGVAGAEDAAGSVLRARGVTPERVEEQVTRLLRAQGAGGTPATELDGDALRAIGVDLEEVRGRIEEAFGAGALDRAAQETSAGSRPVPGGHLRVTREARRCLERSIRELEAPRSAGPHGSAPIALALLSMDAGVPRHILSALGVNAPQLAAEIAETL